MTAPARSRRVYPARADQHREALTAAEYYGIYIYASAERMLRRFAADPRYDRRFFGELIEAGRGTTGLSWEARRLAALMLEQHVLSLDAHDAAEVDLALTQLGLKNFRSSVVHEWLALEGFSARASDEFFEQLQHKLRPRRPGGFLNSREHWLDFMHRSTQERRLYLARYLFRPEEIVSRALSFMRISQGIPDLAITGLPAVAVQGDNSRYDPRPYEAAILKLLTTGDRVYWVAHDTSSRIDSLVEYPLGTVVLVIKPPGSDLEIELKRAGMRDRPLGVVHERDGECVPLSHRLRGGSMGWTLQWEARKSLDFVIIYSAGMREPAPMSKTISLSAVNAVPAPYGETLILDYFSDPESYGDGFDDMREAMSACVRDDDGSDNCAGGLQLTVRFMRDMKPKQSVLSGTSSFRLDKVRQYLSRGGPRAYFTEGLACVYTGDDARRFADDVLDHALGEYVAPAVKYTHHASYVSAAFRIPENRARADANYLASAECIGRFWGAIWAIGGHTNGECFVERNVGLERKWIENRWQSRLVFMDHDGLMFAERNAESFRPSALISGAKADERYIFGRLIGHPKIHGSLPSLAAIYRVSPTLARQGERRLQCAFAQAYSQMRERLRPGGRLRRYFGDRLVAQLLDFHTVIARSLRDEAVGTRWEPGARAWLRERHYDPEQIGDFIDAINDGGAFLSRRRELYM